LALNAAMQSGDLEELRKKQNMARPELSRLRRREGSRASDSNIMIPMSVLDMLKISHHINSLPPVDSSEVIHSGYIYIYTYIHVYVYIYIFLYLYAYVY
jgi:hypothetical protein